MEWALAEAEAAAAQGHTTLSLRSAGMAAMDVYSGRPIDVGAAGDVAYAAGHCCFAAQMLDASHAHFVLEKCRWAVRLFAIDHDAKELEAQFLAAMRDDLKSLAAACKREKWTDRSPVPPGFFGPMWPKRLPSKWPAITPQLTLSRPRRRTAIVTEQDLPADLVAFLLAGRQLRFDHKKTEIGIVKLKPFDHLQFGAFTVTADDTPLEAKDPHRGEVGYYTLQVIDLIGESAAYSPEGLLAWFCDYEVFGSWDCDHHTALGFPDASWSDIVADPPQYLDAQWKSDESVAKYIVPWKHCKFAKRKKS